VPPMVGCMLILLFFIYVLWDRRRKALRIAMLAARDSAVNINPTLTALPASPGAPPQDLRAPTPSDEPLFSIPVSALTAQYGSMAPPLNSP